MSRFKLRRAPLRVATGAFILSTGLDKWKGDEQTAAGVHGFASGTYPFVKQIEPPKFLRLLAASEIAVGSALLLPVVPAVVAGAALVGFSAGLLGLYVRTPGMRRGRFDPRSTPEGLTISKDIWMLGTGLSLLIDGLSKDDEA
jgi:uncharacterized membrane protein YphA (DoxX/SURF4 family)